MFTLTSVESIVGLMTIILAYFFVVTVSGYFRAWVAVKMGDETPEYMGFLKLSPLKHTDPIGFICLIFLGFGWGRYIPIMPFNITGPFRRLKLFIVNFSDVFMNLFIATLSLTSLVAYLGKYALKIVGTIVFLEGRGYRFSSSLSVIKSLLIKDFPGGSSHAIAIILIALAIMYLSVLLAVLNFIISGFGFLYTMFRDRMYFTGKYSSIFVILIPMLLIFFLINPLRGLVFFGINHFVSILAKIFGFY